MKTFFLISVMTSFLHSIGQGDYSESYTTTSLMFESSYSQDNSTTFIIGAKEDNHLELVMVTDDAKKQLMIEEVFAVSNCESCSLIKSFKSSSPLEQIFEEIEQGDVYVIIKEEELYNVDIYKEKSD